MTWTIVMPMAGLGTRLGSDIPKPLVSVGGRPMVQVAIESLGLTGRFVFIIQSAHDQSHTLGRTLREIVPDCYVVLVDEIPQGPAASVLAARHLITEGPLLVANVDQALDWDPDGFRAATENVDGLVAVHRSTDPSLSYALTQNGYVVRTAEKKAISDQATCGLYWFRDGTSFLAAADEMIHAEDTINGEFYIAPVYNYAIAKGSRVRTFEVRAMHNLGTHEGIADYLRTVR